MPIEEFKYSLCVDPDHVYTLLRDWVKVDPKRCILKPLLPITCIRKSNNERLFPYMVFTRTFNGQKQVLSFAREDRKPYLSVGLGDARDHVRVCWSRAGAGSLSKTLLRKAGKHLQPLTILTANQEAPLIAQIKPQLKTLSLQSSPAGEEADHWIGLRIGVPLVVSLDDVPNLDTTEAFDQETIFSRWAWVNLTDMAHSEVCERYENWSRYVLWQMTGETALIQDYDPYSLGVQEAHNPMRF